jgi:hypothetical protein
LSLFFCQLHLSLILIDAHAHQKQHETAEKATEKAEVPEKLVKKALLAKILILVEAVSEERLAINEATQVISEDLKLL